MEVHELLKSGTKLDIVYFSQRFKEVTPSVDVEEQFSVTTDSFAILFRNVLYERERPERFSEIRKFPVIGDYIDFFSPRFYSFLNYIPWSFANTIEAMRLLLIRPTIAFAALLLAINFLKRSLLTQ
jgi:hypothetical protein